MSESNIYVSNGTCYTAPGQKLDESFIPCGNDAYGHQTCCGAGDNCLADNACFGVHGSGYGSFLTYWAGCTDPNYEDITCPKQDVDQPWVALTLCDNSDGEWAICSQKGDPSTLQPGVYCSCTVASSATVAFSDSNSLTNIYSLPQSTSESIQFFGGHVPSSQTSEPATSSASSNVDSTSAEASTSNARSSAPGTSGITPSRSGPISSGSTSVTVFKSSGKTVTMSIAVSLTSSSDSGGVITSGTTPPSDDTVSQLSTGAKVGIGVGVAAGGLILLALIAARLLLRRKRQKRPLSKTENGVSENGAIPSRSESAASQTVPITPTISTVLDANGQPVSEADGRPAPLWTLRSELEGSPVAGRGEMNPIAELPGSESHADEQVAAGTLTQEVNRQIGPAWRGSSLSKLHNGGDISVDPRF
ncbi:MAG: hypothetical protein M1820_010112 [Bogoriella megaspora]|nr:MAG: hypothetical protein M1820_010112 [Bogoriella megaspora]